MYFSELKDLIKGWLLLRKKINNEYIDIITINISIAVIFCIHLIWQLLWQFDKAYFDFIYYFRYYYVCYDSKNIGFIL